MFNVELEIAKNTPGPLNYIIEEKTVKNMRNFQVSIPQDIRPLDKKPPMSPGPGSYETEKLTSLATKIETKNSIKTNFSDLSSLTTKSTWSFNPALKLSSSELMKQNMKTRQVQSRYLDYANVFKEYSNKLDIN
jgi:hypothetical protein